MTAEQHRLRQGLEDFARQGTFALTQCVCNLVKDMASSGVVAPEAPMEEQQRKVSDLIGFFEEEVEQLQNDVRSDSQAALTPSAPPLDVTDGTVDAFLADVHVPPQPPAQPGPPESIEEQLDAGLRFFLCMRSPSHGLYRDKLMFSDRNFDAIPISTSATGFGLIALAISVARGLVSRDSALRLALETLRSLRGGPEFAIVRSANGFMAHWPDHSGNTTGEISTVDTAILVLGSLFASNFFADDEFQSYAHSLATSVYWADALVESCPEGRPGMHLIISADGSGSPHLTRPFNEYYLLAFCGAFVEKELRHMERGKCTRFFEENFQRPPTTTRNYWGDELLSDHPGRFLPSFVFQFCYYLSGHFAGSSEYVEFFKSAAKADLLFWKKAHPLGEDCEVWGCGAGAYPERFGENAEDPYGYKATAIDENQELVYSAPILAGFLPVCPDGEDIKGKLERWHKSGDACKYDLPNGEALLWRASVRQPEWRAPSIEVVDFSTMVFGCAAHVLGMEFFHKYAPNFKKR
mmetsp:Transcript_15801/g.37182  ORF Transcript_15801/g.37182 Transcript_15801/m.37182 type:complete len:522 (+) Transcript_15801:55-1620(+)